jgi:hypothetical protein
MGQPGADRVLGTIAFSSPFLSVYILGFGGVHFLLLRHRLLFKQLYLDIVYLVAIAFLEAKMSPKLLS